MKIIKIIFLLALSIGATAMELPDNDPIYQKFLSRNPDFESDIFPLEDSFLPKEIEMKDLTFEKKSDNLESALTEIHQAKMPSDSTNKGIYCNKEGCHSKPFKTQLYLRKHQIKYHPKIADETTPYVCDICSRAFEGQAGLTLHKGKIHKEYTKNAEDKFICTERLLAGTECGKTFTHKKNLINHQKYTKKHNPKFNIKSFYNYRYDNEQKIYICEKETNGNKCGQELLSKVGIEFHQRAQHHDSLNLTEAALLSNTIKDAQTSITASPAPLNEEQTMLLTADLEKEFQQSDTVENNERIYQQYLADNSSPDFQLSENSPLAQQEISNVNETEKDDSQKIIKAKEIYCNRDECCFKPFRSQSSLYRHRIKFHPRTVAETTPYVCDICSKVVRNATGLAIHTAMTHEDLPQKNAEGKFICLTLLPDGTECGKTFRQKRDLINHQHVHHRDSLNLNETTSPIPLDEGQAILLTTDLEDEFQQWTEVINNGKPDSKRQKTQ